MKRYIAVGGAGSLKGADGKLVMENPHIPAEWLAPIKEGAELLRLLKADSQLDWTFFSPAVNIDPANAPASSASALMRSSRRLMARVRSRMTITRSRWSMSSSRASTSTGASPSATEERRVGPIGIEDTIAGTSTAKELGKSLWNNRLDAGVQLSEGAINP